LHSGAVVALFNRMIADTSPEPTTLAEIVTAAARRADNTQLFTMMCVGIGGALVIDQFFGRAAWLAAAAALGIGAYGAWGLTDRKLNALWSVPGSSTSAVNGLRVARALAAIVAVLSGVAVLGSVFVPALGLWRS
jgi:hypothetical protein